VCVCVCDVCEEVGVSLTLFFVYSKHNSMRPLK
jgi:hypothetical protein